MRNKLWIFLSLGLLITFFYVLMIVQDCLPIAHDTGHYLEQQYVYFNEVAKTHTIPHWFPFLKQGLIGNYHFMAQLMIFTPVVYLLALIVKGLNYLYLFYAGVWFDELFLLLGVLLLGSIYYQRRTTLFFVGLTVFCSTIWYPQLFWGLHQIYFIPILLFCLHRFLTERLKRYFVGMLLVFWVGFIGNVPYSNFYIAFLFLIYTASIFVFIDDVRRPWMGFFRRLKLEHMLILILILTFMSISLYYWIFGHSEVVFIGAGRTAGNGVSLETFMQYGGAISMAKYESFFNRGDRRFLTADIRLYAGFAMPFLALIGLALSRRKIHWPVVIVVITAILFSSATFVSKIFYYVFSVGHFFRHIGLTGTVTKLFVIFLAGFGLDVVLNDLKNGKYRAWLSWGYLLIIFVFLCRGFIVIGDDPLSRLGVGERWVLDMARYVLLLGVVVVGVMAWRGLRCRYRALIALFLAVVTLELFAYKYAEVAAGMPRVSRAVIEMYKPWDYSFAMRRSLVTTEHFKDNERLRVMWPVLAKECDLGRCWGVYYTIESFFFTDTFQSSLRTDFVSVSVKDFLVAAVAAPQQVQAQVYLRYAGIYDDKVRVFSQLNYVAGNEALADVFSRPSHNLNSLWTTADQAEKITDPMERLFLFQNPVSSGFQVPARISIKKFTFNTLVLDVDVQGDPGRPYFLYCAESYHPFWKTKVNGEYKPVLKTNIGYKAVVIPSGHSEVIFYFGHLFYNISVISSLLLCLGVLLLAVYLFWVFIRAGI